MTKKKSKRFPERTCIGCRAKAQTVDLIRLQVSADDVVEVSGNLGGRGAWLCLASAAGCFDRAMERKQFGRSFRRDIRQDSFQNVRSDLARLEAVAAN